MVSQGAQSGRALPILVAVQAVIALLSLLVMGVVAMQIGPMLEEKERLEHEIADHRSEIEAAQQRIANLEQEIRETREELDQARQRLRETADMSRFTFPLDPVDVKAFASRHPGPAQALRLILDLRNQGVDWRLGGQTPEEGFDSPSFAAFVLQRLGMLEEEFEPGDTLLATSRRLFRLLPEASEPGVGDLVFYPAGYVLFRFVDERDRPYVVGMTPMGIVALKPDFAEPVGFRRSGLAD